MYFITYYFIYIHRRARETRQIASQEVLFFYSCVKKKDSFAEVFS